MDEMITEETIEHWQTMPAKDFVEALVEINEKIAGESSFEELSSEKRHQIAHIFCERFHESSALRREFARFIRILARDKRNLGDLLTPCLIDNIFGAAMLAEKHFGWDWETVKQAEMCLINVLFNSTEAREAFIRSATELLLIRIRLLDEMTAEVATASEAGRSQTPLLSADERITDCIARVFREKLLTHDQYCLLASYDLRIAFVASAHSKDLQSRWLQNGCTVFVTVLDHCLEHSDQLRTVSDDNLKVENSVLRPYANRAIWALRVLFNIFCYSADEKVNETLAGQCVELCSKVVLIDGIEPSIEQAAVDVMAAVPFLVSALTAAAQEYSGSKCVESDGIHVGFVDALLASFERRLKRGSQEDAEMLGTFLTVLIRLCTQSKDTRRYVRLKVIPPLHASDVERRPDEGGELRNCLIRIMMGVSNCRELAADFVFILCKKSVNRFVKYCGFGHAAGLLANRGFLGALNMPKSASDSEDSETEDYKAVEGMVNPVTGCIEQRGEDPLAQMSDEQKEFEVHRLMNDLSRLMDQGVIKPGKIGSDGQLQPAKHVLELVDHGSSKHADEESGSDVD